MIPDFVHGSVVKGWAAPRAADRRGRLLVPYEYLYCAVRVLSIEIALQYSYLAAEGRVSLSFPISSHRHHRERNTTKMATEELRTADQCGPNQLVSWPHLIIPMVFVLFVYTRRNDRAKQSSNPQVRDGAILLTTITTAAGCGRSSGRRRRRSWDKNGHVRWPSACVYLF